MNTQQLLTAAHRAYCACADLRRRRGRNKKFTYGDQWSDPSEDGRGSERDNLLAKGYKPLTNNLIRQLVKCIVGRFRYQREERPLMPDDDRGRRVYEENELDELDCRTLEEFLISGCAIQRVVRENRPLTGMRTYVDQVSPSRFFVNATTDPRGRDVEMAGMLHDMSMSELLMRFGGDDKGRRAMLQQIYDGAGHAGGQAAGRSIFENDDFYMASDSGRCRVIEVWTLECREVLRVHDEMTGRYAVVGAGERAGVERVNRRRRRRGELPLRVRGDMRAVWHCRWLSPGGVLLEEYDSPYSHRRHPFAIKFYPLTDGEIHSLVEDVIDQQVYVNRLITLLDRVMTTSAKGALLFPQNQLAEGIDLEALGAAWAAPDSVIPYRPVPGQPEPRQLVTNATNIGARELLDLQMKLFDRISGVTDALQGRDQGGNTGHEVYDGRVRNALISIADLLDTFAGFLRARNKML